MKNLEILDLFEILITQKLLKCPKDPFVRSALIYIDIDKILIALKAKNAGKVIKVNLRIISNHMHIFRP